MVAVLTLKGRELPEGMVILLRNALLKLIDIISHDQALVA